LFISEWHTVIDKSVGFKNPKLQTFMFLAHLAFVYYSRTVQHNVTKLGVKHHWGRRISFVQMKVLVPQETEEWGPIG